MRTEPTDTLTNISDEITPRTSVTPKWSPIGGQRAVIEGNMMEWPFHLLTKTQPEGIDEIEFVDDGRRRWTLRRGELGFPTPSEGDVAYALGEFTALLKDRTLRFSRPQILRVLGWGDSTRSYERLSTALRRLKESTIVSENMLYCPASESRVDKAIHRILDEVVLDTTTQRVAQYRITWSEAIWNSICENYFTSSDTTFRKSLSSPTVQRLFTFLERRHQHSLSKGERGFSVKLNKLAFEHIGMSRNTESRDIRGRLSKAHQELIKRGFITSAELSKNLIDEWQVEYEYCSPAPGGLVPKKRPRAKKPSAS